MQGTILERNTKLSKSAFSYSVRPSEGQGTMDR